MGRHSAPDEPAEDAALAGAATADAPSAGRHQADETGPQVAAPPRRERDTQADLRLLREQPALRARCVAGVLAPFVVYTIVLFVIGLTDSYITWVFAPIIAAGVLVGVILDSAHKRSDPPTDQSG